ncbi:MAG: sugar ABC transporter permease [Lachnospiraceae bacterium]|nr:sugar ABC transporter permease [Lachnospiraceae bacterium]
MKRRWISLISSIFVWGSGQFFACRQKIKGLMFFLVQLVVVFVEISTGYWIEYMQGLIPKFRIGTYGGFFSKGIWGFVTLGTSPGIRGDHSTSLLINGIIVILILMLVIFVYVWNLIDAYKSGLEIERTGKYISSKDYWKKLYQKSFAYIVLTPIGVLIVFFVLMPIIFSVLTAFTNYNRNNLPPANLVDWVGFENFTKLFRVPIWSSTFFKVFKWTVIWTLCATFSTYFFGMLQAVLLNSKYVRFKKVYRGIMILPWAIPQMISLLVFKNMLNGQFGPINQLLLDIGIINERIPFLTDPMIAKITVILVNLWLGFPMFMIMIQGCLSNIDNSLYESAAMDGANGWQSFRKITLPLVLRATGPLLIMNLAGNFNGFGAVFFLTDGGPSNATMQFAGETDILISWIYKMTLDHQMYDMAAVMCIILFVFIGSVSLWNFKRTRAFKEVTE